MDGYRLGLLDIRAIYLGREGEHADYIPMCAKGRLILAQRYQAFLKHVLLMYLGNQKSLRGQSLGFSSKAPQQALSTRLSN
ncbi:hypothetical protein AB1N83_010621 [Pleurotus pulmonarius]